MSENNRMEAAIEAGMVIGVAKSALGDDAPYYAVVPEKATLRSLEAYLDQPVRKRGTAGFTEEKGFRAYVKMHKAEGTRIFADMGALTMTAVIDHHEAAVDAAGWGEHRAHFAPPKDPDWETWTASDQKVMNQMEFAQFVEDNLPAIAEPDGADLLEMAQHLEATNKVSFKSAERLQSGARSFHYAVEAVQNLGRKSIELPEFFMLSLAVFRKGQRYQLKAMLRYRISEGSLALWFHLHRPHEVIDEAFGRLVEGVEVETDVAVWYGQAPGIGAAGPREHRHMTPDPSPEAPTGA